MIKPNLLFKVGAIFLCLSLVLSMTSPTVAQEEGGNFTAEPLAAESSFDGTKEEGAASIAGIQSLSATNDQGLVSVIVKLDDDALATYNGDIPGLAATNPDVTGASHLDVNAPASQSYLSYLDQQHDTFEAAAKAKLKGITITHRYDIVLGGVAALVQADQLEQLSKLPGVVAIYEDKLAQLDTERSPQFIGAPTIWNDLGGQRKAGEGVIVGILDSGIWPEHPSVSDPDPVGRPYAAPPVVPGSNGFGPGGPRSTCDFGNTAANPNDAPFTCNNKLIGAYSFIDTYKLVIGLLPTEFDSARDDNGHGTHTMTTAAGNREVEAEIFGVPRGDVSGVAPRAHVVAYRVCGDLGCFQSDSVRAVQQAILDGVNVINFSIGGGDSPYSDAVELAFRDAYAAGVFVAASAGNSGPGPDTASHLGPWVTTVGASTTDRHFISTVRLRASNGDRLTLTGASITAGIGTATAVVLPPPGQELCGSVEGVNPFPPGTFSGQIVVCQRGITARVEKGFNVQQGGGAGMLLYNPVLQGLATDNHFLPTVHLENDQGALLTAFLSSHTGVTATFNQGTATRVQGDVMAAFSSRGGPGQDLGVSKPDVTAPGVQILAGNTPLPATPLGGPQGELFQAIQGTSMSSPHVAGAAALLKDLHPDWTPGQIKSALMTTAKTSRVFKEDGTTDGDAFDFGSGRIDLRNAGDPSLTFDVDVADFIAHENDLWNVNYPSVYVPVMPGEITVQRTAQNESSRTSLWLLWSDAPSDLDLDFPRLLLVPGGGATTFNITIDARDVPVGEVRFATLFMRSRSETLHIPITIVRGEPVVTLSQTCEPAVFPRNATSNCTISIANTTFDDATVDMAGRLPREIDLVPGTLVGGTLDGRTIRFSGTLAGEQAPTVTVDNVPGGSPAGGYIPLSAFGIAPIAGMGDETIANFNVPAFTYAGETYTRLGVVSNGYLVAGGGTAADIDFFNQIFPDPFIPNNVLAPFWTDLNPAAGGAIRIGILTDGVNDWIVVDYAAVREFSSTATDTFEVWIGINGVQDISFVYGTLGGIGDLGFVTVGAEDVNGISGDNYYADGVGTFPTPTTELVVSSTPGSPAETHTITFTVKGVRRGEWVMYDEMTSNLYQGVNIERFEGEVTP